MSGGHSLRVGQRSSIGKLILLPEADLLGLATALVESSAHGAIAVAPLPEPLLATLRQRLLRPATVRKPLHPLLPAHCPIFDHEVCDYREKGLTVALVADWAASLGLPSRHVLALEQAVDELLLNALYDASATETIHFVRQVVEESENPMTATTLRRIFPSLEDGLVEEIRDLVKSR